MKSKLYLLSILFIGLFDKSLSAQTVGVSISQPDFSTQQAAWSANGNASFGTINSATALILTPSTGNQAGTGFWKQKITLGSNGSFSAFFSYLIDQNNSRADGLTFMLQQQSPTALAATGGGLGYSGFSGTSLAVEFDTWNNSPYDPDNNHIAIDLNGNVDHSTNGGLVQSIAASTLDLADANQKYVWVDYNGSTNLLEVRISYTNTRPTTATISTTNFNLSTMFTSPAVYMGFSAGTGGCWERHSITSFYAINQYQPITPSTNTYAQNAMGIAISSSTSSLPNNGSNLPITVTLTDAAGSPLANQPVTLSIISGTGNLSTLSGTTNSSGQLVVNLNSTSTGSITVQSVAGYGGLSTSKTFSVTSTLPILVSNFTASVVGTEVQLNWNIGSVQGGKAIEILRSSDGVNFSSIGSIEIDQQTNMLDANSYYDKSPLQGVSYYRLALINLDEASAYSPIAMVNLSDNNSGIKILGNPVSNALRITGLQQTAGTAIVYNIAGRMVAQARITNAAGALEISCGNLPAGEYFVQIAQNNITNTLAFVKI